MTRLFDALDALGGRDYWGTVLVVAVALVACVVAQFVSVRRSKTKLAAMARDVAARR